MKAGDIVRLRSGSCLMTVDYVEAGSDGTERCYCVWFSPDGSSLLRERFGAASLKMQEPSAK